MQTETKYGWIKEDCSSLDTPPCSTSNNGTELYPSLRLDNVPGLQFGLNIDKPTISRLIVSPSAPSVCDSYQPNRLPSPFLSEVSSTATFDQQLSAWVATDYVKLKYVTTDTFNWAILTFLDTQHFLVAVVSILPIRATFMPSIRLR